MGRPLQRDITGLSFEEFVEFLFSHEVVPIPRTQNEPEPWYWKTDVVFDPEEVAGHYIRLFTDPGFLLTRYSSEELEQGFWGIQTSNLDCGVAELIWNKRVPLDIRESCVRSMFHLFEGLFAKNALTTSVNMWWDSLAYAWYCDNRSRANGGEDRSMQDVIFETLSKILYLPTEDCQLAALHGLGHLMHPDTPSLIDTYLAEMPSLSEDMREYARAASRFEVM